VYENEQHNIRLNIQDTIRLKLNDKISLETTQQQLNINAPVINCNGSLMLDAIVSNIQCDIPRIVNTHDHGMIHMKNHSL